MLCWVTNLFNRQLPSTKKGSLSNSSSDYGLDESYNSSDEVTDSAFSQSSEYKQKSSSSKTSGIIRPTTLITSQHYTQQYSAQQHHHQHPQQQHLSQNSQYTVQYTQIQKTNHQYSSYASALGQGSNVVYASLQKDATTNNFQHPTPDPWNENRSVANLAVGPPPSLAEQLKQVRKIYVWYCCYLCDQWHYNNESRIVYLNQRFSTF